ncbi:hypothetical protein B0O99DRAFT_601407 [Bisporella sp. PMI_857]|nr:hypothetical protein B0O99DRAFT_601407 [Bisporella sp. PMI_857]
MELPVSFTRDPLAAPKAEQGEPISPFGIGFIAAVHAIPSIRNRNTNYWLVCDPTIILIKGDEVLNSRSAFRASEGDQKEQVIPSSLRLLAGLFVDHLLNILSKVFNLLFEGDEIRRKLDQLGGRVAVGSLLLSRLQSGRHAEFTVSFDECFTPGIANGDIFELSPLRRAHQLSGERASLLDLSSRAIARYSLENRHVLHIMDPFQDAVVIVLWRFDSGDSVGSVVMFECPLAKQGENE